MRSDILEALVQLERTGADKEALAMVRHFVEATTEAAEMIVEDANDEVHHDRSQAMGKVRITWTAINRLRLVALGG